MNLFPAKTNHVALTQHLWLWFSLIVILNLVIKLIHIDSSGLWYDEIISLQSAKMEFGHIKHISEWDKNPPFYYYCLHVWTHVFGDTEYAVRSLSAFFNALAAGCLFLFANRFFQWRIALLAVILFMASPVLFFYAHEARAYSLTVLLAILSSHLFLAMVEKPRKFSFILLGLINFLLIYTHYIAGLVLILQTLFVLFRPSKKVLSQYGLSLLVIGLLVFLRFTKKQFHLIVDFNSSQNGFWLQTSEFRFLKETFLSFLGNYPLILVLGPLLILAPCLFLFRRAKSLKSPSANWYVFLLGPVTVILLYFIGKLSPLFLDRYLLFTLPFFCILIAFSIDRLLAPTWLALSLSLVILAVSFSQLDFRTPKNMEYNLAMPLIKQLKAPNTLVVVQTRDIAPLFSYYYRKEYMGHFMDSLLRSEDIVCANYPEEVWVQPEHYPRILFIRSFSELMSDKGQKLSELLHRNSSYSFSTSYYKGLSIELISNSSVKQR